MRRALSFVFLFYAATLSAQTADTVSAGFRAKRVPAQPGFRVYVVPDMEGMGSVVSIHEVIAGNEGERYKSLTGPDYWEHFRDLLTREVNSVIAGSRTAGAKSFVVNEGHGGNLFANVLPWELDTAAVLIRGFPKPLVMITAIDSSVGTVMFTGAHANAGSPGVLAHNFAFDSFTVNDKVLNEVGINALIAGELGVSVSLVSGDDVVVGETQRMLGNGIIGVVVKQSLSRSAAITYSPTVVRRKLRAAAAEAVRREMKGDFAPFTLPRPYHVRFAMRASYPDSIVTAVSQLKEFKLEREGSGRVFRFTTDSAREMGYLLDAIEETVLH